MSPSAAAEPALEVRKTTRVKIPMVELKKFIGMPTNWMNFWDVFDSAVHSNSELSDIDRFNYLQSLSKDAASEAISGLSASNYIEDVAVLKKCFGNKQQVASKHMELLVLLEAVISTCGLKGLHHLYEKIEGQVRSPRSLGVSNYMAACKHVSS